MAAVATKTLQNTKVHQKLYGDVYNNRSENGCVSVHRREIAMKDQWLIRDWAGNLPFQPYSWDSFEDAEEYLSRHLGDSYETDRDEYTISLEKFTCTRYSF